MLKKNPIDVGVAYPRTEIITVAFASTKAKIFSVTVRDFLSEGRKIKKFRFSV